MNVLIIDHNWGKSWLRLYIDRFTGRGCNVETWNGIEEPIPKSPDVVLCTWADRDFTSVYPEAKHVMMMRRFEFFHAPWAGYNWDKINLLVCCNGWIAYQVANAIKSNTAVVQLRNSIDASLWRFKERAHGLNIGMTCRVHPVKNLALAVQIMLRLPEHKLHIAGPIQDPNVCAYMTHMLGDRVCFYGNLNRNVLDDWWEYRNYCLSTSISEGDPMGVLEAMAKGVKPVIHAWPDAENMYDVFRTVDEAVRDISSGPYESSKFRQLVETMNSASNIELLVDLILKGEKK